MAAYGDVSHVTSHAGGENYWDTLFYLLLFCSVENFILFRQNLSSIFSLKNINQESKLYFWKYLKKMQNTKKKIKKYFRILVKIPTPKIPTQQNTSTK